MAVHGASKIQTAEIAAWFEIAPTLTNVNDLRAILIEKA